MRLTRDRLVQIARETALKQALSDPQLVAAYLTGSVRGGNPFLGNATDIDIIFVHAEQPKAQREIVPLTAEVHLDLFHFPRQDYDRPKELRVHPWLGPEVYDALPLYGTGHFFEFVQAGVRADFHAPDNVLRRANRMLNTARAIWSELPAGQESGPALLLSYFRSVNHAANAIALLNGEPLSERRFLLQFPPLAVAAGRPELSDALLHLLGAEQAGVEKLAAWMKDWQADFIQAADTSEGDARISRPRLPYYRQACESLLGSASPQALLWPLLHTWTLAAAALPVSFQTSWEAACQGLGLLGPAFDTRLSALDQFLDQVEELLEDFSRRT
jgi:hypothetical protein